LNVGSPGQDGPHKGRASRVAVKQVGGRAEGRSAANLRGEAWTLSPRTGSPRWRIEPGARWRRANSVRSLPSECGRRHDGSSCLPSCVRNVRARARPAHRVSAMKPRPRGSHLDDADKEENHEHDDDHADDSDAAVPGIHLGLLLRSEQRAMPRRPDVSGPRAAIRSLPIVAHDVMTTRHVIRAGRRRPSAVDRQSRYFGNQPSDGLAGAPSHPRFEKVGTNRYP